MIRTILASAAVATLLASATFAQSTDSAERSETYTLQGTITAVDAETREVTIEGEGGATESFTAGEEVANFDQIEVGDIVTLEYTEGVALAMAKPGDDGAVELVEAEALAALGEKPGAAVGQMVSFVVEVVDFDAEAQKATVIFPEGEERTVPVHDKMVDFAKSRAPGDKVLVVIGQAVAVDVSAAD
jgi:Cu/Ag efflux protein CusF